MISFSWPLFTCDLYKHIINWTYTKFWIYLISNVSIWLTECEADVLRMNFLLIKTCEWIAPSCFPTGEVCYDEHLFLCFILLVWWSLMVLITSTLNFCCMNLRKGSCLWFSYHQITGKDNFSWTWNSLLIFTGMIVEKMVKIALIFRHINELVHINFLYLFNWNSLSVWKQTQ